MRRPGLEDICDLAIFIKHHLKVSTNPAPLSCVQQLQASQLPRLFIWAGKENGHLHGAFLVPFMFQTGLCCTAVSTEESDLRRVSDFDPHPKPSKDTLEELKSQWGPDTPSYHGVVSLYLISFMTQQLQIKIKGGQGLWISARKCSQSEAALLCQGPPFFWTGNSRSHLGQTHTSNLLGDANAWHFQLVCLKKSFQQEFCKHLVKLFRVKPTELRLGPKRQILGMLCLLNQQSWVVDFSLLFSSFLAIFHVDSLLREVVHLHWKNRRKITQKW